MWPYGFYVLLRLIVSGVAIYAIIVLGVSSPANAVALAAIAILFNPILPIHLPKVMWVPIDLGVAAVLWNVRRTAHYPPT